jgi:hypothetical protein
MNLQDMFDNQSPHEFIKYRKRKQDSEWIAKRCVDKIFWKGKSIRQWQELTGGHDGEIQKHIANGTMEQYDKYRKFMGLPSIRNAFNIKQIMTPKGIMTYAEAKLVFGYSQSETIRNRVRSNKEKYSEWYEITKLEK